MKKNMLLFFAIFIFLGCANTNPNSAENSPMFKNTTKQVKPPIKSDFIASVAFEKTRNLCIKSDDGKACKEVGIIYLQHHQTQQALEYLNKACILFIHSACTVMGNIFENGIGIKQNKKLAYQIYESSCYRGENDACEGMKRLSEYK